MKVSISGRDPGLAELCRRALDEIGVRKGEITFSPMESVPKRADVYIWDFEPGESRPTPALLNRSLFLVAPNNIDALREVLGTTRASIVLKPASVSSLRPFLEHAAHADNSRRQKSLPVNMPDPQTEADNLLECLLHANLKLQEYDQSRTNFLARALHDFRAPLTALSGYCGLLIDQRFGPLNRDQIELLARMQHSINRLTKLSDAMFELSTGNRVKREPDLQTGDLDAVVNQAVHEIAPHADAKQIRVSAALGPSPQPLMFDAAKIEQLLINLLENACKFTPKGGTIEISGYSVGPAQPGRRRRQSTEPLPTPPPHTQAMVSGYRIDVRDSGCGIAPENLESIFEEYTSYGGGADRSGGGLGLAICKMIVQAHGGVIWAESDGGGAQFSLILPFGNSKARLVPEIAQPWAEPKSLSA